MKFKSLYFIPKLLKKVKFSMLLLKIDRGSARESQIILMEGLSFQSCQKKKKLPILLLKIIDTSIENYHF